MKISKALALSLYISFLAPAWAADQVNLNEQLTELITDSELYYEDRDNDFA